ncbi:MULTISPECIES: Sec-independent protein translocase subunit TatA/TatB [Myroides]|jgi:sec-independent protein translocase protein TatA|uniref:Sec-independent protein translocase protein TatA n=1 Tax=Myroides odoratus TaxID=256 RepID=A0A9Q7EB03_MYROD|nr:twin-arginine translocase TatA/TatE family subunit [Myroides odoratus]EHQ42512.1 Sec-independent protein translocase protein tatA/E-like protein [Myroides odoratus DSM 2801]EKB07893.1 TatA/E family twin arginine-targeting protein translocase [Myroides odoratus CIP 103059]MDR0224552.1 twin-arginine translocase TatA/TatE family subunit [Myroides odoratus]QQT99884.1 twin-arginine translocase TatA/TatE family subunit [Myroides odoratus]WQD57901.1 twin-arginine translocase TatA/TatE family subun
MNSLHIFLGMVGPWQIVIIVALILLLFGGKKIPELMKGLGTGIKEFKDATKDENAQQTSKKETTKEDTSKTE